MREQVLTAANSVLFTGLAIVTAMLVGALVIIFSDPDTLNEWSEFFQDPLGALSTSWDTAATAYRALFDSSLNGTIASAARSWR